MKIICVEEHATDPATDEAARPAFGLMDSPNAASAPRNDHRPTMVGPLSGLRPARPVGHLDRAGPRRGQRPHRHPATPIRPRIAA
ncbi:MAG: hypothetical protein ABSA93_36265 [Streptosporangiaceae bacterium]|jgi:hypothetical protein